jgi:hypothetical protein
VSADQFPDDRLREIAQRLGTRAADRLDVEQTAQAVLRRLAEEPRATRPVWRPLWLSLAAALVLLLGASLVWFPRGGRPTVAVGGPATSASVSAALDVNDLSADQLREVLSTLDQSTDEDTGTLEPGVDDLSASELRALLRSLEG